MQSLPSICRFTCTTRFRRNRLVIRASFDEETFSKHVFLVTSNSTTI